MSEAPRLSAEEEAALRRAFADLKSLARSEVPSVRAAAIAALAQVHAALNGQGLAYELYSSELVNKNS